MRRRSRAPPRRATISPLRSQGLDRPPPREPFDPLGMANDADRSPRRLQPADAPEELRLAFAGDAAWRATRHGRRSVGMGREGDHDHGEAGLPEFAHGAWQLLVAGTRDDYDALPQCSPLGEHGLPEGANTD